MPGVSCIPAQTRYFISVKLVTHSVFLNFLSKRLKHNVNVTVECQCHGRLLSQTEADSGHPYIVTFLALVACHLFDEDILLMAYQNTGKMLATFSVPSSNILAHLNPCGSS